MHVLKDLINFHASNKTILYINFIYLLKKFNKYYFFVTIFLASLSNLEIKIISFCIKTIFMMMNYIYNYNYIFNDLKFKIQSFVKNFLFFIISNVIDTA